MPAISLTAKAGLAILLLIAATNTALSADRIALVTGNGRYTAVEPLDNSERDAALIASKLRSVGFEVNLVINTSLAELKPGISVFGEQLRRGGKDAVGLFYYAGHGLQSFGSNYLLPVDA